LAAGAANAADLGSAEPMPAPPPAVAPAFSWTGFYAGLQGGYSWGDARSAYDDPLLAAVAPIDSMNLDGWFGGVEAGANYQFGNGLVIGLEADIAIADISDTVYDVAADLLNSHPGNTITSKTDAVGTVRGRLGFAFDRTLLYGTGGLAVAHTEVTATEGNLSDDAVLTGWTVGAGVEQALTDRVSAKVEYLYSEFGDHTWYEGEAYASTSSSSSSTIRAGLNLHF
jgi:outer membrane immunogenic protein